MTVWSIIVIIDYKLSRRRMDCETEALKSALPQLVARLKANDIIDRLCQANLLTQGEYESFCDAISQNSDHRIVNRNIVIAVRKGPKGSVVKFQQILSGSQPALAGELGRGKDQNVM